MVTGCCFLKTGSSEALGKGVKGQRTLRVAPSPTPTAPVSPQSLQYFSEHDWHVHCSYLTYIKLSTAIRRNENMAKGLHKALLQQQPEDDSKRSPRPQDLIRLYDIILQVTPGAWKGSLPSAILNTK